MTSATIEILRDTLFDSNPAGVMRAMIRSRDQTPAAFDLPSLELAMRTWELASLALIHEPRNAIAAAEERERFRYLIIELKNGMAEHKQQGLMILDKSDFPPQELMDRAILALEYAEIARMD